MKIIISNQSELPIYAQIKEQIKDQILNGQISEGTVLPSIRKLARELMQRDFLRREDAERLVFRKQYAKAARLQEEAELLEEGDSSWDA